MLVISIYLYNIFRWRQHENLDKCTYKHIVKTNRPYMNRRTHLVATCLSVLSSPGCTQCTSKDARLTVSVNIRRQAHPA